MLTDSVISWGVFSFSIQTWGVFAIIISLFVIGGLVESCRYMSSYLSDGKYIPLSFWGKHENKLVWLILFGLVSLMTGTLILVPVVLYLALRLLRFCVRTKKKFGLLFKEAHKHIGKKKEQVEEPRYKRKW